MADGAANPPQPEPEPEPVELSVAETLKLFKRDKGLLKAARAAKREAVKAAQQAEVLMEPEPGAEPKPVPAASLQGCVRPSCEPLQHRCSLLADADTSSAAAAEVTVMSNVAAAKTAVTQAIVAHNGIRPGGELPVCTYM
jgi:hypothetical protein